MYLRLLPLLFAVPLLAAEPSPSRKPIVVTDAALKLHAEALVIDGHNDLPWELRRLDDKTSFRTVDLLRDQKKLQTDLPRLRKGGVGAQFWSAFVPVDTIKQGVAVKTTLEQIDAIHRMVNQYPNDFELALGTADIIRIRKSGKIASLIGIEGGHSIDGSLELLRTMYRLGVRYMTLTHSESLAWADSATDASKCGGLSPFGEEIVREMNAMGMLVDLSHVSPECMKKTLAITKAPVIFSHSSARGVADHPRNVPDEVLPLVKKNGGVIMVNFFSGFVVPEGARAMSKMFEMGRELKKQFPDDETKYKEAMRAWQKDNPYPAGTAHIIVDHIDHLVKNCGIDHVGLGSDYDGISKLPTQMEDVSCYPVLTQEMLNRGYSPTDIKKILGENLMRVFREAEAVAGKK
jgi:membrane dipeptidase